MHVCYCQAGGQCRAPKGPRILGERELQQQYSSSALRAFNIIVAQMNFRQGVSHVATFRQQQGFEICIAYTAVRERKFLQPRTVKWTCPKSNRTFRTDAVATLIDAIVAIQQVAKMKLAVTLLSLHYYFYQD
jgi:hypothetical protein